MLHPVCSRYWFLPLLFVVAIFSAHAQSTNSGWQDGYGRNIEQSGVNGEVFAIAARGNSLFVGGIFDSHADIPLQNIAEWNEVNSTWSPLADGDSNGVNGPVFAIAVDGPCVYVGGRFTRAGGVAANNIACWRTDLRRWAPLKNGVTGGSNAYVASLAVLDNHLFVGGEFSDADTVAANNIAAWDGDSWSYLGSTKQNGVSGTVNALAVGHGVLYVGGNFTSAGDQAVASLASWNGEEWSSLGEGVNGYVNALAIVQDRVIAGGEFSRAGDTTANNIARWSVMARRWLPLAAPKGNGGSSNNYQGNGVAGVVRGMVADNNRVFVTGTFRTADPGDMISAPISAQFIARWYESGSDLDSGNIWWGSLGAGLNGYGNVVGVMNTKIFVGGAFSQAGLLNAGHIARWDGKRWSSLSVGINGPISALTALNNRVWAAGSFNSDDGVTSTHLATVSGTTWQLAKGKIRGSVFAIAADGQHLYAGGKFSAAGTATALNIARYSPELQRWSDLSFGVGGGEGAAVHAIAVHADNVYAGGRFTVADTVNAHNIAAWNRETERWEPLGSGVNGVVNAIAIAPDGTLFVGGDFTRAGDLPAKNIAKWDGTRWLPLAEGVNNPVHALTIDGPHVYVGGEFSSAGSVPASLIASWDIGAEQWEPLGNGLRGHFIPHVASIVILKGEIVAMGNFYQSGNDSLYHAAAWDGSRWNPLESGLDRSVNAAVVTSEGLFVGGDFLRAGTKDSYYFAHWSNGVSAISGGASATAVNIAPNPVAAGENAMLTGTFPSASIAMYDLLGNCVSVLQSAGQSVMLPTSNIPPGIYLCSVRLNNQTHALPLIIH